MSDYFKNVTDSAKFLVMLIIYTGYMTWWASGVSHDLSFTMKSLDSHIVADTIVTRDTIRLAQEVHDIEEHQAKSTIVLNNSIEQHAKCTEIMSALMRRIEKLEGRDEQRLYGGSR